MAAASDGWAGMGWDRTDADEIRQRLNTGADPESWNGSRPLKSVPAKDNRVAGGMLRECYVDDRMLAWDEGLDRPSETNDRFYMKID